MRNITVTLEDKLYRDARIVAAKENTTVTGLVREFFTVLTNRAAGEGPDRTTSRAILETIDRIRRRHPDFDPMARVSREELHSR